MREVKSATVWEWIDDGPQAVASFGWNAEPLRDAERFADWWSLGTGRIALVTVRHDLPDRRGAGHARAAAGSRARRPGPRRAGDARRPRRPRGIRLRGRSPQ